MFNHNRLICFRLSLELAKRIPSLTRTWPRGNYYLEDQLKRAVSSIALNISEGNGRDSPRDRRRFFSIARASATETASIMEIVYAYKLVSESDYNLFQDHLLQIVKILYKLK